MIAENFPKVCSGPDRGRFSLVLYEFVTSDNQYYVKLSERRLNRFIPGSQSAMLEDFFSSFSPISRPARRSRASASAPPGSRRHSALERNSREYSLGRLAYTWRPN